MFQYQCYLCFSEDYVYDITYGMWEIETRTCIRFVERTNEEDYIVIKSINGYVNYLVTSKKC